MSCQENLIGICRDDCSACPRFIAIQSGIPGEMEKVHELWVRLGLRSPDFPAEKLRCQGCSPDNACAYPELRACVVSKSIHHCGECEDYPCRLVSEMFEKTNQWIPRMRDICSTDEIQNLYRAFGLKKENPDKYKEALSYGK